MYRSAELRLRCASCGTAVVDPGRLRCGPLVRPALWKRLALSGATFAVGAALVASVLLLAVGLWWYCTFEIHF